MKRMICLIVAVLLCAAGCAAPAEVEPTPEAVVTPTAAPTEAPTATPEPMPTATPEPEFEKPPVIPGSAAQDIWVNFEEAWNIEQPAGDYGDYYDYYSADTFVDGVWLSYSFYCDCDNNDDYKKQLCSAEFFATGDNRELVELFLGFAATLPYDDADPDAAKAWVLDGLDQLDGADTGTTLAATFGSAEFELIASEGAMGCGADLFIRASGWSDWLTDYMIATYE